MQEDVTMQVSNDSQETVSLQGSKDVQNVISMEDEKNVPSAGTVQETGDVREALTIEESKEVEKAISFQVSKEVSKKVSKSRQPPGGKGSSGERVCNLPSASRRRRRYKRMPMCRIQGSSGKLTAFRSQGNPKKLSAWTR
jgi:hypothetical protein